jgi:ferric-dicitrate binding protein FerR (iron transport regulator)
MSEKRLSYLFYKQVDGTSTEAEKQEFAVLAAQPGYETVLKQLMEESWETFTGAKAIFEESKSAGMLQTALAADHNIKRLPVFRKLGWVAAAIVITLTVGAWYFFSNKPAVSRQSAARQPAVIQPGSNKAMLTLSDGSTVVLDNTTGTAITDKNGRQIINLNNGQLSYAPSDSSPSAISYNTLTTPKGGEFQVILPDGSRVWLNSASSLRYPVVFKGTDRQVMLTGEAYFEVANNSTMPFRVTLDNGPEINVLGTSFNINAYQDEEVVKTTLVAGSVKVGNALLKAGQQSITGAGKQTVKYVNIAEETAWKNGYFEFNELPVEAVMKQLARWYDFEVVFNGHVNGGIVGTIARKESLAKVFELLQQTQSVRFKVNGKKVIVSSL